MTDGFPFRTLILEPRHELPEPIQTNPAIKWLIVLGISCHCALFFNDESNTLFSRLFLCAKMQYKDGGGAGVLILEQLTEYNGGYNTRPVIVQCEFLIHQHTGCML